MSRRVPFLLDVVAREFFNQSDGIFANGVILYEIVELRGQHGLHVMNPIGHNYTISVRRGGTRWVWSIANSFDGKELESMLGFKDSDIVGASSLKKLNAPCRQLVGHDGRVEQEG